MHLVPTIADPNVAIILIAIGVLGIYAEFSSPGLILPGVLGATLALLGSASLASGPLNRGGIALIVIALVAFILEAKLMTHGLLTAMGAASLFAGSIMLVDSPDPLHRVHWGTAAAITVPFALITSFLLSAAVRARNNKLDILNAMGDRS